MQSRVDDPKVVLADLNAEQALAIYKELRKKWSGASFEIIPTPFEVVKYQVMLNTYVITYHFKEMEAFAQGVCAGLASEHREEAGKIVTRSTFSYNETSKILFAFASDIAPLREGLPTLIRFQSRSGEYVRYQLAGEIGNNEGEVVEIHYVSTNKEAPIMVLFND
jgi:hypothetical protein